MGYCEGQYQGMYKGLILQTSVAIDEHCAIF